MGLNIGAGAGDRLPTTVLVISAISTFIAVVVSAWSIFLHLKNYRKPALQRMVIRILVMVPIYAISSLISIFSVRAAFFIDVVRDVYEAFVIYCFFVLLLDYLGGERSLLIMLHGRPPKDPVFPANLFRRELDVSDPFMFLSLKRGILQYVQIKPILAVATVILKLCNAYNEGSFRTDSGYLYISIVYNTSICLALYCLAVFWMCVSEDLKPFRPMPKFLCVKGILFFSFWQSIVISLLVSVGVITRLGPYTELEHISIALTDTLICIEMPLFALSHLFAFSYRDFVSDDTHYVARMPFLYALRDAAGILDVLEDSKATLRGEGIDYRSFEPSEGFMHQGIGRERRIKAGLRYSKGGKKKYWLPRPDEGTLPPGRVERGLNNVIKGVAGRDQAEEVYAPLLGNEADNVVHLASDLMEDSDDDEDVMTAAVQQSRPRQTGYELHFGEPDPADEELYQHSRGYLFGDYNYPCIDVSSEQARLAMWDEEERVLTDERGALFSPIRGAKGTAAIEGRGAPVWRGYGAVGHTFSSQPGSSSSTAQAHSSQRQAEINHEESRLQSPDTGAVRLAWTKSLSRSASPHDASSGSDDSSHSKQHAPLLRHDTSRSSLSKPTYRSQSKSTSSSPTTPSSEHDRPEPSRLPPDAVDLIVEDPDAPTQPASHERRKGESTTRNAPPIAGLKKVYRTGFVMDEDNHDTPTGSSSEDAEQAKQLEIEDFREDEHGVGREEIGEAVVQDLGGKAELDEEQQPVQGLSYRSISPGRNPTEDGGVIARASTPPLHALVNQHDEQNPWA